MTPPTPTPAGRQPLVPQLVFGGCDGVVIALGLIISLAGTTAALVHAAVGAGLAELVGMTAGAWLSGATRTAAASNGGAAFAACVLPALPCLLLAGAAATVAAVVVVVAVAAVIAWLRPERGLRAVAETYGVLAAAAVLCTAAAFF